MTAAVLLTAFSGAVTALGAEPAATPRPRMAADIDPQAKHLFDKAMELMEYKQYERGLAMLNTVVRQIAFYNFELRVHTARRKGELTAEEICDIWMAIQSESLGPAIRFDDDYRWYWTYIPHFVHSPFYVYAYAFGDCLVNSLYSLYYDAHPGFVSKYFDLLKAGGSKHHSELLAPFGLDRFANDRILADAGSAGTQ